MKKLFVAFAALAVALLPLASSAAEFSGGQTYDLRKGQAVNNNLYAIGGNVTVEGDINGDLISAGGNVLLAGTVRDDALLAGGTVNVLGPVNGDLRVVGGNITIAGPVKGEVVVVGGTVTFLSGAKVGKGVSVAGGQIKLDGEVVGKVTVRGGMVEIAGTIHNDLDIKADQSVKIASTAVVDGNLNYAAPKEAEIMSGASVKGQTNFTLREPSAKKPNQKAGSGALAFLGIWFLVKLVSLLVTGLLLMWLVKKPLEHVMHSGRTTFGYSLLRGFVVLVVVPIAAIILFITLIGVLPGIITLILYFLVMMLGGVTAGILFGCVLEKLFNKNKEPQVSWKTIIGGNIALTVLAFIPMLGWILSLVFFLAALGAWVDYLYTRIKTA
ncbi:MAG: polymer-forming cytoskeletal protein [Candidatus Liptonbacteria bacterium]